MSENKKITDDDYKKDIDEVDNKSRAIPEPTESNFEAIRAWGMIENPFAAVDDFSPLKLDLRWLNKEQRLAHMERFVYRQIYAQRKRQDYYKLQDRPISRNKWEFLKLKKSWFIIPLEWDRFAAPDCSRIIDVGCGDGDTVQRVVDHIANRWQQTGYAGHDIEIVGIDLNPTRIKNAKSVCTSPHEKIKITLQVADGVSDRLPFEDKSFGYTVNTAVFEILDEVEAQHMMGEICRITEKGIYVQDVNEDGPGGIQREDFSYLLEPHGFQIEKKHWLFTEPFTLEGSKDPLQSSPIMLVQAFFAIAN